MQIYVNKDGQQFGPYTMEELQQYLQQGHFTAQDFVFYDGCQEWVAIAQVPGLIPESQAAAAQPQAQQVAEQPAQAASQQQQPAAAVVATAPSKKKKIILWSSIGGVAALLVAGLLIWSPWSGDEEEQPQVAEKEPSTTKNDDKKETLADDTAGKGDSTPPTPANVPTIPLLNRIPADALAVASLDLGKVLQKGGDKMVSLLASELESKGWPPNTRDVLKDPSLIGLDVSEPGRIFLLRHPTKADEAPTLGIAVKLEDSSKMKQFFLRSSLAPNLVDKTETKDGYDLWKIDEDVYHLALASDFLFFILNADNRAGTPYLTKEVDRFMTSDGSNSLVDAHPEYELQESKGYDLGVWINLEKVGSMAEGEAPDELLGLVEGGSLSGGLRFDDGEAILELNGASKGLGKALGGEGISSDLAKYLITDAPLAASLSMNMDALVEMMSGTLSEGADLDLDEPIDELGVAPREVLDVFQGGFAFSLTKLPPLGGGAPVQDEPARFEEAVDPGNFGEEGKAGPTPNPFTDAPSGGADPFGGTTAPGQPEIAVDPPLGVDPFGGGSLVPGEPEMEVEPPPLGGTPPPNQFGGGVLAASIDDAKWSALMQKSKPLAGLLAMAQLMGVTIKAENGMLVAGTAEHATAVVGGGVPNPIGSTQQSTFTSHDLGLRITSKSLVKALMDEAMHPAFGQALGSLESLVITADSAATSGSLSVTMSFTDKRTNGLLELIDLIEAVQPIFDGSTQRGDAPDKRGQEDIPTTDSPSPFR